MTLKPFKSPVQPLKLTSTVRPRVEASIPRAIPEPIIEDYSDLGIDESETELESKFSNLKVCRIYDKADDQIKGKERKGILRPSDLRKIKSLTPAESSIPPKPARTHSTPLLAQPPPAASASTSVPFGSTPSRRRVSPNLGPPQSPRVPARSPPPSRQNSVRANPPNEVDVELQKYQEDEDDWDDMFVEGGEGVLR